MGSDIHMITQVRQPDGSWLTVKPERACPDCEGTGKQFSAREQKDVECWWCDGKKTADNFGTRSYDTFAILANVRNGYGFAGCTTGEGFKPISKPKGYPEDLAVRGDEFEGEWLGDHSHSWLTLAELLAYDWEQQATTKSGLVTKDVYAKWRKTGGYPERWSGDVWGGNTKKVSQAEMVAVLDKPDDGNSYYTRVDWVVTYKQAAREFCESFIPALQKLGAPEDVRIVFGFDS